MWRGLLLPDMSTQTLLCADIIYRFFNGLSRFGTKLRFDAVLGNDDNHFQLRKMHLDFNVEERCHLLKFLVRTLVRIGSHSDLFR